ncbi:Kae1-associated kinase Bud32 [Candidatus Woesearchaeota archaeon]|nr:Kae1-associated kinase Bud32 [Candidatus Woesearchaeota archaeon]|tara:strand:- start:1454 stop:2056 length:603 start_codon:yes stop_codon:yes gene_type:complete
MKKLIAQGAESKLFLVKDNVIKNRFKKNYRIKEIDEKLRKFRTKREAKVLQKLEAINFPSPKLIENDEKENLEIEYIKGKLLKDILEKNNYVELSKEIGEKIAILHNNNIIHGDLTTSNMVFNKKVYFIDYGLSLFSHKIEDRAVDLHLLKEALESKHYKIWEKCYKAVLEVYEKKAVNGKEVLKRLKVVESRGRYKRKH